MKLYPDQLRVLKISDAAGSALNFNMFPRDIQPKTIRMLADRGLLKISVSITPEGAGILDLHRRRHVKAMSARERREAAMVRASEISKPTVSRLTGRRA